MAFDTPEIKEAFETFGKEVVQLSRSNLTRGGHNVDKTLYESIDYDFTGYKGGFRLVFEMEDYGKFVDEGVKGSESSQKAPQSPYKFTNKMPPRKAISGWVRNRRFQFRQPNGRFMTYESTAFLIQRSIFEKGVPATKFFINAFEKKFERLAPKIEDAMEISVEKLLDFALKERRKA